ncbi:pyruvate kinase 2-like isoform X2 [Epargyreus clarus]|uniref:pyruvate kinase 2-like isoform X2 n=1 Tax=Epargyreus clarus TaxID=520877 RepID=UPI003C2F520A
MSLMPQYIILKHEASRFSLTKNKINDSKEFPSEASLDLLTTNDGCYDAHDIKILTKSGVNIFNVDRIIYGEDVFQKHKAAIIASEKLHEMYPERHHRPIGLAVIMTITELIDIDNRVDLIILKDVESLEGLLEFKKHYRNKKTAPIVPWIKTKNTIELNQIIKFSDGIVVDDSNTVEENCCKINLCKQYFKPVFYIIEGLIQGYRASPADERKIFAVANKIVKNDLDGVLLLDNYKEVREDVQTGVVKSLVLAIDVVEKTSNKDKHSYKLTLQLKIPMLPPKSVALAACLAAKQSGASAIIVFTSSGSSARLVASGAPPCHILAITTRKETARRLHLYRKVIPLFYNLSESNSLNWHQERWKRIQFCTTVALQIGICHYEANIVILAPSSEEVGYCNSLQIISMPLKCEELTF